MNFSIFDLKTYDMLEGEQLEAFGKCAMHLLGHSKHQHMVLRASAGTGKTFTANCLISFLAANGIKVTTVAFTGRAASRLKAQTCHSLLYQPVVDNNGDLVRWDRKPPMVIKEEVGYGILVDEGSMISKEMHNELSAIGVPIIYIGDDKQLDPVVINNGRSNTPTEPFNVMTSLGVEVVSMVEMRRFNPDSGIAEIAEYLRDNNAIKKIKRPDVKFVSKTTVNKRNFFRENDFDLVVCGTNKTRKRLTENYREGQGWEWDGLPAIGERVMCLRNDVFGNTKVYNGEMYTVMWVAPGQNHGRYMLCSDDIKDKSITIDILNETWETEQAPPRTKNGPKYGHFTFGYVVTCHKAQGSTMDRVLFIDEDVSFFTDQQKYRYTGITRAAKNITIAI